MYSHVAELYDTVYEKRTQDVAFYASVVADVVGDGARVLEVGAGTGRVLLPLAAEHPGSRFVALDIDRDELDVLEQAAADRGLANVEVRHGGVAELRDERSFDLVIAPFRVLQHALSTEELQTAFTRIAEALAPGGTFVFDLFNPSIPMLAVTGLLVREDHESADGTTFTRSVYVNERDHFAQTQLVEERYEVKDESGAVTPFEWIYTTRYFFRDEVVPLLVAAGLSVAMIYGSFDREVFGTAPYPGELIFVCRRDDGQF